ncbi:MarR family transcriptional regulator [Agrobacterium larrymoorei]|uniref:MarR family winged helix-turn-helix transcriptional regulator n=1 Tax=Agrobacterium larrymoorei TaxID=160699 RepID=UPI001572D2F6|nr:MarR family transcriptional regulator [Agrobacterium larrymoorei]NTJ43792.1 MarR family transcriptional regulator [Agrobacterium larrymoorei]
MKNEPKQSLQAKDDAGELEFGELDGILGFHLRMANVAIFQDYQLAMSGMSLTPKQFAVLELIGANEGVSQMELATSLRMDKATMMALINRLEERNLCKRGLSTTDRRRRELTITSEGTEMLQDARKRRAGHEERFKSRFTPSELETFINGLKRIYNPSNQ